jgi:hypothetical protein
MFKISVSSSVIWRKKYGTHRAGVQIKLNSKFFEKFWLLSPTPYIQQAWFHCRELS